MLLKSIVLFLTVGSVNSAKILFFGAFGTHSTRISQWPLMEALAERGHSITYLSAFKAFDKKSNASKIITYEPQKLVDSMLDWGAQDVVNFYEERKTSTSGGGWVWFEMFEHATSTCEALYSDSDFKKWVKSSKFDLVIVETFLNECAYGLVHFWKAKLIGYSTSTVMPWIPDIYGLPDETSSTIDMVLGYAGNEKMTFRERFGNALMPVIMALQREWSYLPKIEGINKRGLEMDLPIFKEIERNASLFFISSHYSLDDPRSFPPHTIPIGGIVVSKEVKPLSPEMSDFIEKSPNGFVFISFGTVANFAHVEESVQIEFVKALGSFKEMRFVWKLQKELEAVEMPDNVFVAKWVPQQTILGHSKIKAFITHAGMGSMAEAVHFGVPLVCLPILGDQDINADIIVKKNAGVKVEIVGMKREVLEKAVGEVLNGNKYRQGMKDLSRIFHDRPVKPLESAVWWTEYILRHDSINDYIIPPSVKQPWWKRRQIDIWLSVGVIMASSILLAILTLKYFVKFILLLVLAKEEKLKIN